MKLIWLILPQRATILAQLSYAKSLHSKRIVKSTLQDCLKKIVQRETNGAILRWHESGEHSIRYFFNLERRNLVKKTITKLKRSNGTTINDHVEILRQHYKHYKTLYSFNANRGNLIQRMGNADSSVRVIVDGPSNTFQLRN